MTRKTRLPNLALRDLVNQSEEAIKIPTIHQDNGRSGCGRFKVHTLTRQP